jgi:tetratricopeptide (TPR) repeat protein
MLGIVFSRQAFNRGLLVSATLLLMSHRVSAESTPDSDREVARIATKQAAAAYNLGDYSEAASLYEKAYKLVPDPILLYDIGQSYRQGNKLDKALIAYRSYLRTAPENAPNREQVKKLIDELEWTSDLQAKAAAMKTAQKKESPQSSETPAPGEHVVPFSGLPRLDLVLQAPQAEPTRSPSAWKRWAPWIGTGVTVALGIATIVEGLSARSSFHDLQGTCGKTKTCTDSQVDGAESKVTATNVLLGVTAVSAAATGVLFVFSYPGGKETGISLAWRY